MFGSCFRTLAVNLFQIIYFWGESLRLVPSLHKSDKLKYHFPVSTSPVVPNPTKSSIQDKHPLCYKCITRTAPSYLCDCLPFYTPSRTLRSASDTLSLQIPRTRLSTVGSRAFSVFGPSTWNDLPLPLRQKPSLDSFKCNLKTFLFPKL